MTIHAGQSIMNDHGHFISKGRVIGFDLGGRHRQDMTVSVLMLQTLTGQSGTT